MFSVSQLVQTFIHTLWPLITVFAARESQFCRDAQFSAFISLHSTLAFQVQVIYYLEGFEGLEQGLKQHHLHCFFEVTVIPDDLVLALDLA
jgi:hypothetical protein